MSLWVLCLESVPARSFFSSKQRSGWRGCWGSCFLSVRLFIVLFGPWLRISSKQLLWVLKVVQSFFRRIFFVPSISVLRRLQAAKKWVYCLSLMTMQIHSLGKRSHNLINVMLFECSFLLREHMKISACFHIATNLRVEGRCTVNFNYMLEHSGWECICPSEKLPLFFIPYIIQHIKV